MWANLCDKLQQMRVTTANAARTFSFGELKQSKGNKIEEKDERWYQGLGTKAP